MFTKESIIERIAENFDMDASSINTESNFKEDLRADSIDLYQMVVEFEDEVGIQFEEEELTAINTVEDLITLIQNHQ